MKIPEEKINEVKEATDIVDVISQYVPLKRKGNSYFGLCPFHQEKTPSFHVDPVKAFYHCFGCGEGGNVFSFIMKMDRVSFPEAVQSLARKANIELPKIEEDSEASRETEALYHVNRMAAEFFRECLLKTKAGQKAEEYISNRGFESEITEKFLIGYAPNRWDGLILKAERESVSMENLEKAGLIIPRRDGSGFYDRFRGRLMFPVLNTSGRVVGFGGRALKEDKRTPKYINSPETRIYRKSHILYGLYQSRDGIRQKDQVIFVEGYTDLMRLHQFGFVYGVATSGTALTEGQARLVSRYTRNVLLVYDGDSAGFGAAVRGADVLLASGLHVQVCPLPPGSDPDTFLKENGGKAFQQTLSGAKTLVEFQLSQQKKKQKLKTPSDKSQAATDLLETIGKIRDPMERQLMVRELAENLGIDEALLHQKLQKMKKLSSNHPTGPESVHDSARMKAEKALVRMLSEEHGCWTGPIFSLVKPEEFSVPSLRRIAGIVFDCFQKGVSLEQKYLLDKLNGEPEIYQQAVALISDPFDQAADDKQLGLDCILFIKEEPFKKEIQIVREAMKNKQGDESDTEDLRDQWLHLRGEWIKIKTEVTKNWKKMVEKL